MIELTIGVSGSGKTTYALEQLKTRPNLVNVNRDDIRQILFGPFVWSEYKFTDAKESQVTIIQKEKVMAALQAGKDVIISDTNLTPAFRSVWQSIAEEFGVEYKETLFLITESEAFRRNENREMSVSDKVIRRQMQTLHTKNKPQILDHFKKLLLDKWDDQIGDYIIVDIDGTVANHVGTGRSPFEWHKVGSDTPRETVIMVVKLLLQSGKKIVFLSGRDGSCEKQTRKWLEKHIPFSGWDLYMRTAGDSRPDWIVKSEILLDVNETGKPLLSLDDRDQVVEAFRHHDIEVFQVQYGNF